MRSVSDRSIAAASSRLREGSDLAGRCCLRPGKCAKEIEFLADRTISAKAPHPLRCRTPSFRDLIAIDSTETTELIEHNG